MSKFNMVDFANGVLRQQRDLGVTRSDVTMNVAQSCKERYEMFKSRGKVFVQYEYRHVNGETFNMIGYSLEECRRVSDSWINKGGY